MPGTFASSFSSETGLVPIHAIARNLARDRCGHQRLGGHASHPNRFDSFGFASPEKLALGWRGRRPAPCRERAGAEQTEKPLKDHPRGLRTINVLTPTDRENDCCGGRPSVALHFERICKTRQQVASADGGGLQRKACQLGVNNDAAGRPRPEPCCRNHRFGRYVIMLSGGLLGGSRKGKAALLRLSSADSSSDSRRSTYCRSSSVSLVCSNWR
jgi:hypothetical protein